MEKFFKKIKTEFKEKIELQGKIKEFNQQTERYREVFEVLYSRFMFCLSDLVESEKKKEKPEEWRGKIKENKEMEKISREMEKSLDDIEVKQEKIIKEISEKIVAGYKQKENELTNELKRKGEIDKKFTKNFFSELGIFPFDFPPTFLEKIFQEVINKSIEKYKDTDYDSRSFSLFLSFLINKSVQEHFSKGGKETGSLIIHLDLSKLPKPLRDFGYKNSGKCYLLIEGNLDGYLGREMNGGIIKIKGNPGDRAGSRMIDGYLEIEGDAQSVGHFMSGGEIRIVKGKTEAAGEGMKGGYIVIEGDAGDLSGVRMEGGYLEIKGNAGKNTGLFMRGGVLEIKGNVKGFDKSVFSPKNRGVVIWRKVKIFEDGRFTKEGWKMMKEGEIPFSL